VIAPRILVTGASSPLGQAVGKRLRAEQITAVGTVRPSRSSVSLPMFDELLVIDLENDSSLQQIGGNFDAIIHVAAASYGQPADLMRVTGLATEALAQVAIDVGIKKFVHVSAISVYGQPDVPLLTSHSPIKHSTPYGAAKWAAECYLYNLRDKISSVSVRSPAIVGSRPSTHTHFMALLLEQLLSKEDNLKVSNPDFLFNNVIHEDTLAEFLVHLSLSPLVGYRALPVGSLQEHSLKNLIDFMAETVKYPGQITWDRSSSLPFAIALEEAIEAGFRPISARQTLERWLHRFLSP